MTSMHANKFERSTRVEDLYDAARLQADPDRRAAYLEAACAGDAHLRDRLEALLSLEPEAEEFFADGNGLPRDPPKPDDRTAPRRPSAGEKDGDQIGRYRLLRKLGEGGCGEVFLADQEHPVRRHVALKVIKLGMDTRQVIARFEGERQALARMEHPNIAHILDAGATDSGRPYFVMELVDGPPITRYCDQLQLPIAGRLQLFVQICQAIQHAHHKGVIHRDLKPSNILVVTQDGVAIPKVIDFGIAKAIEGKLADQTVFTAVEQFIGTPAYMSPEQATAGTVDVDTRSDIYSLGIVLYELLAGRTPFQAGGLRVKSADELRRMIREVDPVTPSSCLKSLPAPDSTAMAKCRGTDPSRLAGSLRGDLDSIVMKCLEKEPARRYATANGLAADVQRYLQNEPVVARAPGGFYRLRKFVHRHRWGTAAAAAMLATLLAGISIAAIALVRERRAHDEARSVLDFLLQRVVMAPQPQFEGGLGRDISLAEALHAAEPEIAEVFREHPEAEAQLRRFLGRTYLSLGYHSNAISQFESTRQLLLRHPGIPPEEMRRTLDDLAYAYQVNGNPAEKLATRRAGFEHAKTHWGKAGRNTLAAASTLGVALRDVRLYHESTNLLGETLEASRATLKPGTPMLEDIANDLGFSCMGAGDYPRAIALLEGVYQSRLERLGPEHPETTRARFDIGYTMMRSGTRVEEGFNIMREVTETRRQALGREHSQTLLATDALALANERAGRWLEAAACWLESCQVREVVYGTDHPTTQTSRARLESISRSNYFELDHLRQTWPAQQPPPSPRKPLLPSTSKIPAQSPSEPASAGTSLAQP